MATRTKKTHSPLSALPPAQAAYLELAGQIDALRASGNAPENLAEVIVEQIKASLSEAEYTRLAALWQEGQKFFLARGECNLQGFECFFEIMTGMKMHREAKEKWLPTWFGAQAEGRGALTEAHREGAKSTYSKIFDAFLIGHKPEGVGGLARINDNKGQEKAAAIANLIDTDPRWKMVFPYVVPDKDRGWGAETGYYVRDTRLNDEQWAQACDGRPDGPTWVGRGWKNGSWIGSHFNLFLDVDDILDENNTASMKELQGVTKFYTDTLSKTVMKGCYETWEFTPWLKNDTYAYVKNTGAYRLVSSPVMRPATPGEAGAKYWEPTPLNPDYPEAGNIALSGRWWHLTWEEVFDFERIAKEYRTSGAVGFARMMLLDLGAMEGLVLKREWLHEYPADRINPSWPTIFGIDYASTTDKLKQKDRDNFSLAIKRAIPGGGLVLVDGYLGKLSKGEALAKVAAYAALYPTLQMIGVENIGKGEEFYNDLLLTNDTQGRVLPLMAISHGKKSKGERLENWLAPRYQAARCWISDTPTPFIAQFIDAWISYPNGLEDDSLDSDYMATAAGEGYLPNLNPRTVNNAYRPTPTNYVLEAYQRS